jgi:hypothetical protein
MGHRERPPDELIEGLGTLPPRPPNESVMLDAILRPNKKLQLAARGLDDPVESQRLVDEADRLLDEALALQQPNTAKNVNAFQKYWTTYIYKRLLVADNFDILKAGIHYAWRDDIITRYYAAFFEWRVSQPRWVRCP